MTDGGKWSESGGPAAGGAGVSSFSQVWSVIWWIPWDLRESRFNPDNLDTTGLCYQT